MVAQWCDGCVLGLTHTLCPPHRSRIWPCSGFSYPSKCSSHYRLDKSNIYRKISRQNLYFQKTRFLYHLQLIVSYHIRLCPAEPTQGLLSPSLMLVLHRWGSAVCSSRAPRTLLSARAGPGTKEHPLPHHPPGTPTSTGMCSGGEQPSIPWVVIRGRRCSLPLKPDPKHGAGRCPRQRAEEVTPLSPRR